MNTLLDERCMRLVSSPTGKRHVQGWYGETLCGKFINFGYQQWGFSDLTSVRFLGKIAQGKAASRWYCKTCLNNYKDVDING